MHMHGPCERKVGGLLHLNGMQAWTQHILWHASLCVYSACTMLRLTPPPSEGTAVYGCVVSPTLKYINDSRNHDVSGPGAAIAAKMGSRKCRTGGAEALQ